MASEQITFDPTDTASAKEAVEARIAVGIEEPPVSNNDLSRKAENLIAAAQKLLEQMDVQHTDASAMEVDREVRQALNDMNEVYVSHARHEEFAYAWIYRDPHNEYGGRYVRKMQALGWEVVQGDDPEAREHKFVDGTRVVADCVLIRIRLDRKYLLDKRDSLLRQAQQAGIVSRVHELAERAGTRVYDKLPGFVEESLADTSRERRQKAAQGAFHRMNQGGKVDSMLREGRIPGIPAPGAGRR